VTEAPKARGRGRPAKTTAVADATQWWFLSQVGTYS
jgi:hypothetical protein